MFVELPVFVDDNETEKMHFNPDQIVLLRSVENNRTVLHTANEDMVFEVDMPLDKVLKAFSGK